MLRIPLQSILSHTAGSTSGSVVTSLPTNDFTCLVGKLTAQSFFGDGSVNSSTLDVFIQTSDDGGTSWYDVGHFAQVRGTVVTRNAKWLTLPVNLGDGAGFANATDQSLAANTVGLPLLSNLMKLKWTVVGAGSTTTARWTVTIYTNSTQRT